MGIALEKAQRLEDLTRESFEIARQETQGTSVLRREEIQLSLMLGQLTEEFMPAFQERNLAFQSEIEPKLLVGGCGQAGQGL